MRKDYDVRVDYITLKHLKISQKFLNAGKSKKRRLFRSIDMLRNTKNLTTYQEEIPE